MGLILLSTTIVLTDLYVRVLAGEKLSLTEGAKVIPQDALMAIYISTDSRIWGQLPEFGTPTRMLMDQMANWKTELGALEGIDFQQDIQPWIGNAVLALFPSDNSALASKENLLLVVGIKNKIKAFNFARKLENQRDKQIQISSYRDIPIVRITKGDDPALILAVLNKQVFVSFNQKTVEQAIDTFKGNPSLASANVFASVDQHNQIVQVYVPNYNRAFKEALRVPDNIHTVTSERLELIKSVVLGVEIDQPGLRLWAIAKLDPTQPTADGESIRTTPEPGTFAKSGEIDGDDRLDIQVRQALTQFLQAQEIIAIEPLLELIEKIDVTVTNTHLNSSPSSSKLDQTKTLELLLFLKP